MSGRTLKSETLEEFGRKSGLFDDDIRETIWLATNSAAVPVGGAKAGQETQVVPNGII